MSKDPNHIYFCKVITKWSLVLSKKLKSVAGKMNMMVWGKLCWYSNPETMFPLANVLHVVLSTTLKWASNKQQQQQGDQELWDYPESTWSFNVNHFYFHLFFLQQSSRLCTLLVPWLSECYPPGCRAPPRRLDRNHLDCWWNAGLPGEQVLVSHWNKKESTTT